MMPGNDPSVDEVLRAQLVAMSQETEIPENLAERLSRPDHLLASPSEPPAKGRGRRSWTYAAPASAAAGVILAVGLAVIVRGHHSHAPEHEPAADAPYTATVPSALPTTCGLFKVRGPLNDAPWVGASRSPTGATVILYPATNQPGGCSPTSRELGPDTAKLIASWVDSARQVPSDFAAHCPEDTGAGVAVYLSYADRPTELVNASTQGCPFWWAPGRRYRFLDGQALTAITALLTNHR